MIKKSDPFPNRDVHNRFNGPNQTTNNEKNIERDLHSQFVDYGRNAKDWLRKCALLLPEIDRRQVWRKKGFSSIYEYAAKLAGMSKYQVQLALWTVRKIENKPALMKLAEQKGVHAVRPVANVATIESDKFWAEKARNMSKHTLETYVHDFRQKQACPGTTAQSVDLFDGGETTATLKVTFELRPTLARKLEYLKKRADFEDLLEEFVKEIEAREEAEKPEPIKNAPRHMSAKMENYVNNRTGGQCAWPGCDRPIAFFHHTQRYALEKVHDPDRLWGLCKAHNEIAHNGLIENEEGHPSTWRLREQPDKNDIKHWIDQQVATYRRGG